MFKEKWESFEFGSNSTTSFQFSYILNYFQFLTRGFLSFILSKCKKSCETKHDFTRFKFEHIDVELFDFANYYQNF